jgi:hypothetical protein
MSALDDKLNAHARIQLAEGELPEDLEVMLRLEGDLTEAQASTLKQVGVQVKGRMKNVVVANSRRDDLERLADCGFVKRIEVSQPLHDEGPAVDE